MNAAALWLRRGLHALVIVGEAILLYAGLAVICSDEVDQTLNLLVWNVVAYSYLGVGAFVMRRRAMRQDASRAEGAHGAQPRGADGAEAAYAGRGAAGVITHIYLTLLPAVFSVLGLTAAVIVLFDLDGETSHDVAVATKGIAALVMVSAWLLLHVSYARAYRMFYAREGGGLDFPETASPGEADFLYFAMTIGSSFATSDVGVTSTRMRWHVLVHSVMSFFYNAIVLAVGFRVLTGG